MKLVESAAAIEPRCENCRYAFDAEVTAVECRRYPIAVTKHRQDHCGEYAAKERK